MSLDIPLVTFVDPGPVSWLTRSCLKSAVRQGHTVHAYAYGEVIDLPKGVAWKDAEAVIPKSEIFHFDGVAQSEQSGSLAPFADALRYKLLQMELGVWVDWDVYFLKPIDLSEPTILAWEGHRPLGAALNPYQAMVGNAVMRIESDSPVIRDLVNLTSSPYQMPPWLSPILKYKVRKKLDGKSFNPGAIRYAEYGPIALSYYVKKHKMKSKVGDFRRFYPIDYRDTSQFLQDNATFLASLPERSETIHLWNSSFKRVIKSGIPNGSFAARLREESLDA